MIRKLFFFILACSTLTGRGQTKTEDANRAVFNKIEFFINTQMSDSIYNMASARFQEEVSRDQLTFMLQRIYQLGRITDVQIEDFKNNTATYRIHFTEGRQLLTNFAIDSAYSYTTLAFTPADPLTKKDEKPDTVNEETAQKTERKSSLALYMDTVAKAYLKKENTKSLAVATFHKNKYHTYLYGETEEGNNIPPTEESIYKIGSVTKLFTATLLADLVTNGRIQLDDPIAPFLPDSVSSNPALQGVTFKMLANHSSGLPSIPEKPTHATYDRKALFNFLKSVKTLHEPGEEYEYSHLGYAVLGELIAVISEKPYTQCLEEKILTPLQLHNTTNFRVLQGQKDARPGLQTQGPMDAADGLKSNIRDLMLFAIEQFKMPENDLQKAMALTRQFTFFTPDNMDIGLAWHMSMLDGLIYFHQMDATPDSSAFIGLCPDTKTIVIVLSNAGESVRSIGTALMEKLMVE